MFSEAGILVLHWSRQIGKSFILAAWAVSRLFRYPGRTVTVLSNSKQNGTEFIAAAARVSQIMGIVMQQEDQSSDGRVENMRTEIRVTVKGQTGKIIVLAANPRTARGFSGDLILDEFAFHENSRAIWDAAEPIISSNRDYQCRVSSTGNGRFNLFYEMANASSPFTVSRIRRSEAWEMGVEIFDPRTRQTITPQEARAASMDKASYDQNYECAFQDENTTLLTHELISSCEYGEDGPHCFIESQDWSYSTLAFLAGCLGPLCIGVDIGRNRDLTVIAVGEKIGGIIFVRAILRLANMRGPQQLERFKAILGLRQFGRGSFDKTGLGTFLIEFAQDQPGIGEHRAEAINFASKEAREVTGVEREDTALVTELMALDLLRVFEDRAIRIPPEQELRDDLRKPERIVTANGSVKIAATRDEAGHADAFWAMALLVRALKSRGGDFGFSSATDLLAEEDESNWNREREIMTII